MFESVGPRVPRTPSTSLKDHLQTVVKRLLPRRSPFFHTRQDVERILGLPVLAVYPRRRDR